MHTPTQIRKTKIVATIGPACDSVETLGAMIRAGMNVARLNLSHGTVAEHRDRVENIRQAAKAAGTNIAIMIDTRGIEIRTAVLKQDSVKLDRGATFTLYMDQLPGDVEGVSVSYNKLASEVSEGDAILLDDGAIELEAEVISADAIRCRVIHGGRLKANKSVNLPDTALSISATGPENREDILRELGFAADNDVDYIAASFVQTAADIEGMREILKASNVSIPIIAKIENKAGVANLDEIIQAADGLMVARGDLGVELPFGDVPGTQKRMIQATVSMGKPVITATQMLASMEVNPKPTRAEASDVANAILDGTSAIMLSGETAAGKYPVEAVATMDDLALRAESYLYEYGYLQKIKSSPSNITMEAVSQAATGMAKNLDAAAIFSLTESGFSSRRISKYRPKCPILAITGSKRVARQLSLNWGVIPLLYDQVVEDKAKLQNAIKLATEQGLVCEGNTVVVTAGHAERAGSTDMIRVIQLDK